MAAANAPITMKEALTQNREWICGYWRTRPCGLIFSSISDDGWARSGNSWRRRQRSEGGSSIKVTKRHMQHLTAHKRKILTLKKLYTRIFSGWTMLKDITNSLQKLRFSFRLPLRNGMLSFTYVKVDDDVHVN
ncbi:hypothetical protein CASFOL_036302 [Castilleja foliolosa]|uniref:Uncharacterized protein n=1 Tax=Castilleja foliolosa TaxID=1961234 RepID=A0ABD3BV61_9LAMI